MTPENMDSFAIKEPGKFYCWLSGDSQSKKPDDWYGPWMLQVAHIASGAGRARRVNDRRAVVLLSPLCHMLHVSNSDSHPFMVINGKRYPTIDERHTLYIKREMDPDYYSPEYLSEIWIGNLPQPDSPPDYWCERFMQSTGIVRV